VFHLREFSIIAVLSAKVFSRLSQPLAIYRREAR
jgi:hypothetical protein